VSYPGSTDGRGEFDAFVQVAFADGIVPQGNGTELTQGVELFTNVSMCKLFESCAEDTRLNTALAGNASSYLVPTQGITLVADIDDILRVTKIWKPDEGLRNSFVYPFTPWMNMPGTQTRDV
jgi:hypothetical protein